MSTSATVHFQENGETAAIIYIHGDGNPECLGEDLKTFFVDVRIQTKPRYTRFNDPRYLAAKFVVWQAARFASNPKKPLDFISIGIMIEEVFDISYRYLVGCNTEDNPSITVERV